MVNAFSLPLLIFDIHSSLPPAPSSGTHLRSLHHTFFHVLWYRTHIAYNTHLSHSSSETPLFLSAMKTWTGPKPPRYAIANATPSEIARLHSDSRSMKYVGGTRLAGTSSLDDEMPIFRRCLGIKRGRCRSLFCSARSINSQAMGVVVIIYYRHAFQTNAWVEWVQLPFTAAQQPACSSLIQWPRKGSVQQKAAGGRHRKGNGRSQRSFSARCCVLRHYQLFCSTQTTAVCVTLSKLSKTDA